MDGSSRRSWGSESRPSHRTSWRSAPTAAWTPRSGATRARPSRWASSGRSSCPAVASSWPARSTPKRAGWRPPLSRSDAPANAPLVKAGRVGSARRDLYLVLDGRVVGQVLVVDVLDGECVAAAFERDFGRRGVRHLLQAPVDG